MRGIQFIGTQRSGSNLLRLMLNQVSDVSAPHPPHLLHTFIPHLDNYGDLNVIENRKHLLDDMLAWIEANPVQWSHWNVEAVDYEHLLKGRTIEDIFTAIYELKAEKDNCSIWCCKSLANVKYVERVENQGIHPFYLHIVRDGRDVACSFKKAFVGPKHIYNLASKWSEEQALAKEISLKYPDRYCLVRYEDLIAEPLCEMQRLCEIMDLDFDEKVLKYYSSEESEATANSGEMWKNVVKPIDPANKAKYLNELDIEEINMFDTIAHRELSEYGYEVGEFAQRDYTGEELSIFNSENQQLMDLAQENAHPTDIELRRPQRELLKMIENRKFSVEL